MGDKETPVIIKKIKKGHAGGHHGGAWKVAYADFVTAMMALFLVLWLVATMSVKDRSALAHYFRSYTIFKGTEAGGGKGISVLKGNPVKLDKESGGTGRREAFKKKIASHIGQIIENKLEDLKDHILIFTTSEGVRVEMVDKTRSSMFELGKANLLQSGDRVLRVLAESLQNIPNNISIEGHTDRYSYPGEEYTNWELAADRANAVRRALIRYNLNPERITKVSSFADRTPIEPDKPFDAVNRRVTLLIEVKKDVKPPGNFLSPANIQEKFDFSPPVN